MLQAGCLVDQELWAVSWSAPLLHSIRYLHFPRVLGKVKRAHLELNCPRSGQVRPRHRM